jgi:hypothetical protein
MSDAILTDARAIATLIDIGQGMYKDWPLPDCPECHCQFGTPLAVDDDPRFHPWKDFDVVRTSYEAMVCRACGTGWMCTDRHRVQNAWIAYGVWTALGVLGRV